MSKENAQRFLAWVVPWPSTELDHPEFFVNIHAPSTHEDGKDRWGGRACLTGREAVNYIEWSESRAGKSDDKYPSVFKGDIYVCMSAQRMARPRQNKKTGRTHWLADRNHPLWHQDLYVDVDVKPNDPTCYP